MSQAAAAGTAADTKPTCEKLGEVEMCGEDYEAPSHGKVEVIYSANVTLQNRGKRAAVIEFETVAIVDRDEGTKVTLAVDFVIMRDRDNPRGDTTKVRLPAGARVRVIVSGKGELEGIFYNRYYHHAVTARRDKLRTTVRAGNLYFREPHRR